MYLREDATLAPFNRRFHVLNPMQVGKFHDTWQCDLPKEYDYDFVSLLTVTPRFGRINKEAYMENTVIKSKPHTGIVSSLFVNLVKEKAAIHECCSSKW